MTTMIVDCKNLAMSTLHSTGTEINDNKTGIIYGFLEKLLNYQVIIQADKFIFCWDSIHYFRRDIYHKYKIKNIKYTEEEAKDHKEALRQMEILKKDILPRLGFKYVYEQYGFEADDLIAQYVKTAPQDEEIVILSSDKDLWQLIERDSNRIRCYSISSKRFYSDSDIFEEFGVHADRWGDVKSISGCDGDKVDGIVGVADKRASNFLRNTLTQGEFYGRIVSDEGKKTIKFNKRLVILPFKGKRIIDLKCKNVDLQKIDFIIFFRDYKYFWWLKGAKLSKWFKTFNLK